MAQLSQKRLFLLDMDGTIYLSDRLFDRVPEFLARVRGSGGRAVFLTNNSSRGVEDYIEKLRAMGIETAREEREGYEFDIRAQLCDFWRLLWRGIPRFRPRPTITRASA